jgi:hypothetical protein
MTLWTPAFAVSPEPADITRQEFWIETLKA